MPAESAEAAACDVRFASWRTGADGSLPELLFAPDGAHLVVDGRWSFDTERSLFRPIVRCSAERSLCLRAELSFAPSGARFVLVSGQRYALGTLEGELESFRPIPRWLAPDASGSEVANVVAFLSHETLLIHQSYADGHGTPSCRLLDLATQTLRTPSAGCPQAGFSQLASLAFRSDGLVTMLSSAEGTSELQIARYAPDRASVSPPLASVTLQGWSSLDAWIAPDAARVEFASPCELRGNPAPVCEGPEGQRVKLYEHSASGGTLRLLRDDLPAGSIRDPRGERFAWVAHGALCIGSPDRHDERCTPLPSSERSCR